jgi:hypothetical protein
VSQPDDPAPLADVTTGHPRVDAALAALAEVAEAPPVQQIGPLTEAHDVLRETLDSIGDV